MSCAGRYGPPGRGAAELPVFALEHAMSNPGLRGSAQDAVLDGLEVRSAKSRDARCRLHLWRPFRQSTTAHAR